MHCHSSPFRTDYIPYRNDFKSVAAKQSQHFTTPLICSDIDFNSALEMVKILVQHAAKVFDALPAGPTPPTTSNPKLALLQALPAQFDRAKYIEVAAQLQIPDSTADKQIARFLNAGLIIRQAYGSYVKKAE